MPGQNNLILDENTAKAIAENLAAVVWLANVKVRVTNKAIQIGARYRKPLALIKTSGKSYYIDDEFILKHSGINQLLIVTSRTGIIAAYITAMAVTVSTHIHISIADNNTL